MGLAGNVDSDARTIEGNLERIDLASVLQVLQSNGSEGVLELASGDLVAELFYCTSFGITLANRAESLGRSLLARLLHQGRITEEQHDHVLCECASTGENAVDALHAMEIVDEHVLVDTLRECLEEEIYALFFLEEGTFRFRPMTFDAMDQWGIATMEPLGVPLDRLVLEAVKRLDDWSVFAQKIPTLDMILQPDTESDTDFADSVTWRDRLVLGLVDSQRSIEEIVALSSLSTFEICETIDRLLDAGRIRALSTEDLVRAATRHLKRNETDVAIKLFSLSMGQGNEDPEILTQLAVAHEKRGETEEAAAHLLQAAELRFAGEDLDRGFAHLCRAAELVPGDVEVATAKMEAFLQHPELNPSGSGRGIIDEAITLSRRLVKEGKTEKAVELLRRLDGIERGNLSVKSEMIELLLARGLVTEAIAEYEKLGSFLVARGQLEDARRIYRKILSLDHRRFDIAEKLKKVERMRVDRRGRNRRLVALICILLIVGGLAGAYSIYSSKAERIFREALALVKSDPDERSQSIERLRDLVDRFPLAPAARDADDEARRLQVETRHHEVDVLLRRKAREGDAARSLESALERIDEGEIEQALVALQQAIDLAPSDSWAIEHDLENQKARLLSYLEEAENLYGRSREAARSNDWDEAFDLTHRLIEEYRKSPFARMATIPVRLRTVPSGAAVMLDGEPTDLRTPCAVMVDPFEDTRVSFRLRGYEDVSDRLLDPEQPYVMASLRRLPRWSFETGGPVVGRPAVLGGTLYVGSRDSTVYALDPTEAKVEWKTRLDRLADIESAVVVGGDRLYLGANDRKVYALDRDSGEIAWTLETSGFVKHAPVIHQESLFVGCSKGFVYHIDAADGTLRWRQHVGGRTIASPDVDDESVRVLSSEGSYCELARLDGEVLRRTELGVRPLAAVFEGGRFVFGTAEGEIACHDATDGRRMWTHAIARPVHSLPTLLGESVIVGADDGVVRRLALVNGELLAQYRTEGIIRGSALVSDGRLYVGSSDRQLYCLESESLDLVWKGKCEGPIDSTPFEAYGAIYVGCGDHRLYCFAP